MSALRKSITGVFTDALYKLGLGAIQCFGAICRVLIIPNLFIHAAYYLFSLFRVILAIAMTSLAIGCLAIILCPMVPVVGFSVIPLVVCYYVYESSNNSFFDGPWSDDITTQFSKGVKNIQIACKQITGYNCEQMLINPSVDPLHVEAPSSQQSAEDKNNGGSPCVKQAGNESVLSL